MDEEADEQGIAHLVEHVTFLGSRQREGLLGTGARSNAYTDFHHTVFHVHSPLTNTGAADPTPMLPQVRRENLHSMLLANTTVHHYVLQDCTGILPLGGLRPSYLAGLLHLACLLMRQVLDALAEIAFNPEFLVNRIEKERKAVLAEAQMMNTIEYRVDCQLLQYLHEENALGYRFPIGKTEQVWRQYKMLLPLIRQYILAH